MDCYEEMRARGLHVPTVDVEECVLLSKAEYERLKAVQPAPTRIALCRLLRAYQAQCEAENKRSMSIVEMRDLITNRFPDLWN